MAKYPLAVSSSNKTVFLEILRLRSRMTTRKTVAVKDLGEDNVKLQMKQENLDKFPPRRVILEQDGFPRDSSLALENDNEENRRGEGSRRI